VVCCVAVCCVVVCCGVVWCVVLCCVVLCCVVLCCVVLCCVVLCCAVLCCAVQMSVKFNDCVLVCGLGEWWIGLKYGASSAIDAKPYPPSRLQTIFINCVSTLFVSQNDSVLP
jgi:hypothetical protein